MKGMLVCNKPLSSLPKRPSNTYDNVKGGLELHLGKGAQCLFDSVSSLACNISGPYEVGMDPLFTSTYSSFASNSGLPLTISHRYLKKYICIEVRDDYTYLCN